MYVCIKLMHILTYDDVNLLTNYYYNTLLWHEHQYK